MYDEIRQCIFSLDQKIKMFNNFERYFLELEKKELKWSVLHSGMVRISLPVCRSTAVIKGENLLQKIPDLCSHRICRYMDFISFPL